jgi:hypothetical protein
MEYKKYYTHIVNTLLLLLLVSSSHGVLATEVEPNDVTPQVINFDETIVGQLSSTTDIDKYSLEASGAGTLTLTFTSDIESGNYEGWDVQLLDEDGSLLSSTHCHSSRCESGIAVPIGLVKAGTYIVNIKSYSSSYLPDGLYRFSTAYTSETAGIEFEPNDVTPQVINFDENIVGQLSSTADIDFYSLMVTGRGQGSIILNFISDIESGNHEGWDVQLLDESSNLLSSTKCSGGQCADGISIPVGINVCQTYQIRIKSNSSSYLPYGLYTLNASEEGLQNSSLDWINSDGHGIIPEPITNIDDNLLSCATNLTSITIPNTVTSIGSDAFRDTGLTSLVIPDSVKTLGSNAFYGAPIESLLNC